MQSFLKTKKVLIEALGRELEIVELCAKAQIEIMESLRELEEASTGELASEGFNSAFLVCKHGVPEWSEETVEAISLSLPLRAASEIAQEVYELSGIAEAKNSESVPSEDLSTDSRLN